MLGQLRGVELQGAVEDPPVGARSRGGSARGRGARRRAARRRRRPPRGRRPRRRAGSARRAPRPRGGTPRRGRSTRPSRPRRGTSRERHRAEVRAQLVPEGRRHGAIIVAPDDRTGPSVADAGGWSWRAGHGSVPNVIRKVAFQACRGRRPSPGRRRVRELPDRTPRGPRGRARRRHPRGVPGEDGPAPAAALDLARRGRRRRGVARLRRAADVRAPRPRRSRPRR